MWKDSVLTTDTVDGSPVALSLYTGRVSQIGSYVTVILGADVFPPSGFGQTPKEAINDAMNLIKSSRRYEVVDGPNRVGVGSIRAMRWNGQLLLVHFRLGAPLSDDLFKALSGATPSAAQAAVSAESGSPLYSNWAKDETVLWDQLPKDIDRLGQSTDDDDDLADDEFWRP